MISEKLNELIRDYFCVALIGTEKNAGKTTVLASIMENPSETYGITGIGRDGESVDVVFGTEKPRILIPAGTLVATAAGLMKECDCKPRILCSTSINTPLGEVYIFRAEQEGFVQIGGPSMVSQLVTVRDKLAAMGAKKVIIDGALGRKTFSACALADAAILVSGASNTPDMSEAVEEAAFIARTFFFPTDEHRPPKTGADIILNENRIKHCEEITEKAFVGARKIVLSGALTDGILKTLSLSKRKTEIAVADPGKIVSSRELTCKFLERGNTISVFARPVLLAICSNPHSIKGYSYNAEAYAKALKEKTGLPVIDVKKEICL